jgi:hypothetical protein
MLLVEVFAQYFHSSPAVYMLTSLGGLILINLILTIVISFKSKDIRFELLPDFIIPLLLYSAFILTFELLTLSSAGVPALYSFFMSIEIIGVISIALKYVKKILDKLKVLGLVQNEKIENKLDSALNEIEKRLP